MKLKFLAIALILVLILNFILFALKAVNPLVFWLIILIIAFIAYKVIPRK
jgi:hypothetical protein